MPVAWRIVKKRHAATAFTGDGAAKTGGRWNSRGVPVVYASATLSLATLEILVHLNPVVYFDYVAFRIEFDDALMTKLRPAALPKDWRAEPPSPATQHLGDDWVRKSQSPILAVPSVIVPLETNYLINPNHPDYKKIKIAKPEPFRIDARLTR